MTDTFKVGDVVADELSTIGTIVAIHEGEPHPYSIREVEGITAYHAKTDTWRIVPDLVNQPPHYTDHPSGIECIQITEHMGYNLGNALKYIWRCDLKADAIEDLEKAKWYIEREIARRTLL